MNIGQLQGRLNLYLEAERKILLNQSYTIGTRTYERTDLKEVRDQIDKLNKEIQAASGVGTIRPRKIVMRDD